MIWVCAGNSVGKPEVVKSLLSSACTEWRTFLLLVPVSSWGRTRSWEGTQPGRLTGGIFQAV